MKPSFKKMKLNENNPHLKDIFSDGYYLELGTITPKTWRKILKYKEVRYSEVTCFDISNNSIGKANINNQTLKNKMPFYFFQNLLEKKPTRQLFITYGIKQEFKAGNEKFRPMLLVPINIYFKEDDIWIGLSGMIIENNTNPRYKKTSRDSKTFTSIYALDDYCYNNCKGNMEALSMENYLTFADIVSEKYPFVIDKFELNSKKATEVTNRFYLSKEKDICQVTNLNEEQRVALIKSDQGYSFGINGPLGSGRTTTLVNIAANAIYQGKRVLYLSSQRETLDQVYSMFEDYNLQNIVTHASFNHYHKHKEYKKEENTKIDKTVDYKLSTMYQGIEDYNKILYKKKNGFSFLDVLNGMIKYSSFKSLDDEIIEEIENISKLDLEEIIDSLTNLDDNLSKIPSFTQSIFYSIPIKVNISPDKIMEILLQLLSDYRRLISEKDFLQSTYGLAIVRNYAYIRNMIRDYKLLNKDKIPRIWLVSNNSYFSNFEKAQKEFLNLIKEIKEASNLEEELSKEYLLKDLYNFNVDDEIKLLESRFKTKNEEDINNVLKNIYEIESKLFECSINIELCQENFAKMKTKIPFKFDFSDLKSLKSIADFFLQVQHFKLPKVWLDIKNIEGIKDSIIELDKKMNRYNELVRKYHLFFSNLSNLDDNIEFLEGRKKLKDKYKKEDINSLILDFKELRKINNINSLKAKYQELTGYKFPNRVNIISKIEKFTTSIKAIKDKNALNKIIAMFKNSNKEIIDENIKPFMLFTESFEYINDIYNQMKIYKLISDTNDFSQRIKNLKSLTIYIGKISHFQEKIKGIIIKKSQYVKYHQYLELIRKTKTVIGVFKKIDNNQKYKQMFSNLFNGYYTNIGFIEKQMNSFQNYINIFDKDKDIVKNVADSFDEEKDRKILLDLRKSTIISDNIEHNIAEYSKIFKEPVRPFYYGRLQENIQYLETIIGHKKELSTFLFISKQLRVLSKYRLQSLIKYIIDKDIKEIVNDYMGNFYNYMYQEFIKENPNVSQIAGYQHLLREVINQETRYIENKRKKISLMFSNYQQNTEIKPLYVNNYLQKYDDSKRMVLANSRTINYLLDVSLFDLILIDDAQLLSLDQNTKSLAIKQVIIAGARGTEVSIMDNIFSIIKKDNCINFNHRYFKTPISLIMKSPEITSNFSEDVSKEKKMIVSESNLIDVIFEYIYCDNKLANNKINIFMSDILKTKNVQEQIANRLLDVSLMPDDIENILFNDINITDITDRYYKESDINILCLEDYYNEENEHNNFDYLLNLLYCKKKVIVVDINNRLKEKTPFVDKLNKIIKFKLKINDITDEAVQNLVECLRKKKIKVLGRINEYSIIIERRKKYQGILICNVPTVYDSDILNSYRKCLSSDVPFQVVYLQDFARDRSGTIKKIVEVINERARR